MLLYVNHKLQQVIFYRVLICAARHMMLYVNHKLQQVIFYRVLIFTAASRTFLYANYVL